MYLARSDGKYLNERLRKKILVTMERRKLTEINGEGSLS